MRVHWLAAACLAVGLGGPARSASQQSASLDQPPASQQASADGGDPIQAAFPPNSAATQIQTNNVPTPEEAEVAKRMSAAADAFLASFLGPGRAKVLVSVEGERSRTHTKTEIITPITLPSAVTAVVPQTNANLDTAPSAAQPSTRGNLDLPGYAQDAAPPLPMPSSPNANPAPPSQGQGPVQQTLTMPHFDFFQRDQEETSRVSGFILKKLKVTCILDSKLSDAQAATAAKLIPDLFHIDSSRGDEISIVRADMVPYWKTVL